MNYLDLTKAFWLIRSSTNEVVQTYDAREDAGPVREGYAVIEADAARLAGKFNRDDGAV